MHGNKTAMQRRMREPRQQSGPDAAPRNGTANGQHDDDLAQAGLHRHPAARGLTGFRDEQLGHGAQRGFVVEREGEPIRQSRQQRVDRTAETHPGGNGLRTTHSFGALHREREMAGDIRGRVIGDDKLGIGRSRVQHRNPQLIGVQKGGQPIIFLSDLRILDHASTPKGDRDDGITPPYRNRRPSPGIRHETITMTTAAQAAAKFDGSRAEEYERQSRIALAGYEACHELAACLLAASLGSGRSARILVAGAGGTANEILTAGALEPAWHFTAVDPAPAMLDLAMDRVARAGLSGRTTPVLGTIGDLPQNEIFDAATLIGVLHHLPGDAAKRAILADIAAHLPAGAPFILACNHYAYASQPLLLAAWGERWRMQGASPAEVQAKLGRILQGADPPDSEQAVAGLLQDAGFAPPLRFFSSLFWGAWISRRL